MIKSQWNPQKWSFNGIYLFQLVTFLYSYLVTTFCLYFAGTCPNELCPNLEFLHYTETTGNIECFPWQTDLYLSSLMELIGKSLSSNSSFTKFYMPASVKAG